MNIGFFALLSVVLFLMRQY